MKLTDEQRNAVIETFENAYEKHGVTVSADKVYDFELVLTAVKHYGYAMGYRAKKNQKDGKFMKALNSLSEDKRAELLATLGIAS